MPLVLGIESTTRCTKVEIRDADDGKLFGSGRAEHPGASLHDREQDPNVWWNALVDARRAAGGALGVSSVSVAAQSHGLVVVDGEGAVIRPAMLRDDDSAVREAAALVDALDSPAEWTHACGSVPSAAFPIAKLAWLRQNEPDSYDRIARAMLPHDWLTFRLSRRVVTERGDASATGYFSPRDNEWRTDLLDLIDSQREWPRMMPRVLDVGEPAGDREGVAIAAGTGDTMGAALGLGMRPRDVLVMLEPACALTVRERPTEDPSGRVAGLADANGHYLPMVLASAVLDQRDRFARVLGLDANNFDRLALEAPPGAGGITFVPPRADARPNRPPIPGALHGITDDLEPALIARAVVESVAHGILDDIDALRQADVPVGGRLFLVGETRSHSLPQVLADLTGRAISLPKGDRIVAGACVQAAATATGASMDEIAATWGLDRARELEPDARADPEELRASRRAARRRMEER